MVGIRKTSGVTSVEGSNTGSVNLYIDVFSNGHESRVANLTPRLELVSYKWRQKDNHRGLIRHEMVNGNWLGEKPSKKESDKRVDLLATDTPPDIFSMKRGKMTIVA
jgi:hypothetical protein